MAYKKCKKGYFSQMKIKLILKINLILIIILYFYYQKYNLLIKY